MDDRQEMLAYYQAELDYLRSAGADYARRYPKIARRLELSDRDSADPHVERLIESFAFLTGRLQHNIDAGFPQIPAGLLGGLHPHLLEPVPSMTIARFDVSATEGPMIGGYTLPRHTQLLAPARKGQSLRFRTAYPVTLWPVRLAEARIASPRDFDFLQNKSNVAQVLVLSIERLYGAISLGELGMDSLRFHLTGDPSRALQLLEWIKAGQAEVVLVPQSRGTADKPIELGRAALTDVGFGPEEGLLPEGNNQHPSHLLLREYFVFPEKFLFFDIKWPDGAGGTLLPDKADRFDLMILAPRSCPPELAVGRDSFALGCTPIVNLFPKVSEPLRVDERRSEYRLSPDTRLEWMTEIHSIQRVTAAADRQDDSRDYRPFFSVGHGLEGASDRAFWLARRRPSEMPGLGGTDLFLSFFDLDFHPEKPSDRTLFAHTLCCNRDAAEQLPAGASLAVEQDVPVSGIVALAKPTRRIQPPMKGETLWMLVSQLSLNHLSLSEDGKSLDALKEILTLHNPIRRGGFETQLMGLSSMRCEKAVRRLGDDAWRGFVKGMKITLNVDEQKFVGNSLMLFGDVLSRFLANYATINHFTQLAIRRKGDNHAQDWITWPAMVGTIEIV